MTKGICIISFYLFVAVNFICDHPAIKAISFVGSNSAGEYIYERGSKNGKRVQSNMVQQAFNVHIENFSMPPVCMFCFLFFCFFPLSFSLLLPRQQLRTRLSVTEICNICDSLCWLYEPSILLYCWRDSRLSCVPRFSY